MIKYIKIKQKVFISLNDFKKIKENKAVQEIITKKQKKLINYNPIKLVTIKISLHI